jgi:hypothetical protein
MSKEYGKIGEGLEFLLSFKRWLLHKHNPSETLDDDLQKISTNKSMA